MFKPQRLIILLLCLILPYISLSSNIAESAPVEVIIKLKPESLLASQVKEQLTENKDFSSYSILGPLNKKYQLQNIKAFKKTIDAEEVKRRFPTRASRAPQGAKTPDFAGTYIFIFATSDADAKTICQDYMRIKGVEYAQPNYAIKLSQ